MNWKAIKKIEKDFFSLTVNERLLLLKRISVRMSPYMPHQGPVVSFFSPQQDASQIDVDLEKEVADALQDWEEAPPLSKEE